MSEFTRYVFEVLKAPNLLSTRKHLFLLSHMRANTSLIGHLLGDHEQISGYYEMHIGYYSWKSFIRQKLMYATAHQSERLSEVMFDKILHNDHEMSDYTLNARESLFLISIREPVSAVKSAVSQFRKTLPEHEFTSVDTTVDYYLNRLTQLQAYSDVLKGKYFYYDAEDVVGNPNELLPKLSRFIGLKTDIVSTFKPKALTGVGAAGDHSGNLLKGEIVKKKSDYSDIVLSEEQELRLKRHYDEVRVVLQANAKQE
jgi:hypothetical protein